MTEPISRRTLKELLTEQEPRWLFRNAEGKALGPVPEAMLLKGVLRGTLDEATMVRPEGQPQWRPISAYSRLTRALAGLRARISGVHDTREARSSPLPRRRQSRPPRPRASGE